MAQKAAVTVDSLIIAAGKAGDTMLARVREAARMAATELDHSKPLADRIAEVMKAHADAFTKAGHNVRALFSDALTLLACPADNVEIPGPKDSIAHHTAAQAVDLAKHGMREAAKQVRAAHGIGRKTTPKPVITATAPKIDREAEFKNVLAELTEVLKDADQVDRLIKFLDVAGFVMARKVSVKTATRTKPTMADLPATRIKGAAQSATQAAPF